MTEQEVLAMPLLQLVVPIRGARVSTAWRLSDKEVSISWYHVYIESTYHRSIWFQKYVFSIFNHSQLRASYNYMNMIWTINPIVSICSRVRVAFGVSFSPYCAFVSRGCERARTARRRKNDQYRESEILERFSTTASEPDKNTWKG